MATEFRDKFGRLIPPEHWENDPGPPGPPTHMSPEEMAKFNRRTEELKRVMEEERARRARTKEPSSG